MALCATGDPDALPRQVEPGDVEPPFGEAPGVASRAAAEIEHGRTAAGRRCAISASTKRAASA